MADPLPPFFSYYSEYFLLTCSACLTAIHPTKISDHLTTEHPGTHVTPEALDSIRIMTSQPIDPIPTLASPREGFQCKVCKLVRLSQRTMRNHIHDIHQINGYGPQDARMTSCLIQALEGTSYLFRVNPPATRPSQASTSTLASRKRTREPSLIGSTPGPSNQRSRVHSPDQPEASAIHQSYLASFQALRQNLKASRVIQVLDATHEASSFFSESGYPAFLNGKDAGDLERLFTLEDPDQSAYLFTIIHRLLSLGQNQMKHTTTQSLAAINSFSQDPINQMSLRPLRALQNPNSMRGYALIFQAYLAFLLNSFRHLSGGGPSSYLGLYTLNSQERNKLEALEAFLLRVSEPEASPSPDSDSSDSDDSAHASPSQQMPEADPDDDPDDDLDYDLDSDEEDEVLPQAPQLPSEPLEEQLVRKGVSLVMNLTLLLATRHVIHQREVPLYAFLACFSRNYSQDCFKTISLIGHSYSAIIKSHQFILLHWLHTEPFSIPERQPESMAVFIRNWMTKYFTGQSESPLGHVTSLGKIHLVAPHTLRYGQVVISQGHLRHFLAQRVQQLALALSNDLFLDFGYFREVKHTLDLDKAAQYEDISQQANSWSFLRAYLDQGSHDYLLQKVLPDSDWFTLVDRPGGPTLQLVRARAKAFLESSSAWLKQLLALCHITSGAPARGTEINQVIWQNTPINPRNLFLDPNMTSESLAQPISLSPWRHLMQGFIRHGLGLHDPLAESGDDLDDEALGADQMHHSRDTGLRIYGREVASFQGVRADIQTALVTFSQRWHAYLGLAPDQEIWQPQADHSPEPSQPKLTRGVVFPLDQPIVQFHYPPKPKASPPTRKVSIGQFNEFISLYRLPQAGDQALRQEDLDQDLDQGQLVRQLDLSRANPASPQQLDEGLLDHMLKEFMQDDQVTFRSPIQRQAFHLIMKQVPYLIMVLPTAAGKTTLFLFGASLATSQVTMVIVPLISLKLDLSTKAATLGLEPTVWEPGQLMPPASSRVILVQIEHLEHPRFQALAGELIAQKRLARIIWDECHLIPLAKSYRPIMLRAWHALALPVPMVFSSATLPHHLQQGLIDMMKLGTLPQIPMVRADLTLPNMAYRVEKVPDRLPESDSTPYLRHFIKNFKMKHGPFRSSAGGQAGSQARARAKVIIFCRSKRLVDALYDQMDPEAARFHSDLSDQAKLDQLNLFQSSRYILVATGAIGAGFDFPDINLVIHFLPGEYEMTSFIQESGRAGRSPDQPGWSYYLVRAYYLQTRPKKESKALEILTFLDYLGEQVCRRAIESCDPSWALCDLFRQAVRQEEGQNLIQMDDFVKLVIFWHERYCLICFISKDQNLNNKADTCCWRCLLPTRVCKGPLTQADITRCLNPDLLLDLPDDPNTCLDPTLLP
ncbi:telomere-associated RecQ helicase [Aspergillus fumigatus]